MSRRFGAARLGREALMLLVACAFIFPFYVFFTVSMKTQAEVASNPLGLPTTLNLDNFATAWDRGDLGEAYLNSIVVVALSVLILVGFGSMAAYTLARRLSRLSTVAYLVFLVGLMIPLQLGMVPLYQFMNSANLLGTWTALILFEAGHQLPFTIFLYAGFIRALPREYEEAARVDGAGPVTMFRKIVFPLLRPITGTVVILTGITTWNDFLTPLLYVGGSSQQTLPVAIYAFRGEFATDWGVLFAGMAIAIIPLLIVYFFLQKYFIIGFASGIKG
ncbi:carbohydrate ABC transporter permease [Occultella aeris]|uniref:L-arabinose transport system permease protein AraQ n=1 Tax=Occultella aeris TaxID=2761496 RepID=A0A7M4DFE5_9MICO|nr:carbohydrate ABC transporter permease [Occultella aeris]VZO35638.1 L-arabinose transport system permease protein AraQ [Occultella aeris]